MKTNNCLILITSIILALAGFVWVYKGTRAEIVVGVVFFIFALVYAICFIGNVVKKAVEDAEEEAEEYRNKHIENTMFIEYDKDGIDYDNDTKDLNI